MALMLWGGLDLTLLWFNLAVLIPFSERLWAFFNELLGGQVPGTGIRSRISDGADLRGMTLSWP
jgi:hypothetical protein